MNRRLTRSRNSLIGGVAAGVAEWIDADPGLIRIAWALLVPITGGAALLAYIVAWVVLPEAGAAPATDEVAAAGGDPETERTPARPIDHGRTQLLLGGALVLVGLWFLVREYLPDIDWGFVWPLALVAAGIAILVGAMRR
ncbi:MAG TPA: PspC domain-containing protein [Candidatus Limnocylindrales bacterium]|nr:PspC domain-containing protein [Candidatus Limnocylindrales bacterium]